MDQEFSPRPNKIRLAIVVSHPIQYYTPLYRSLAKRDDVQIKVFFTWHAASKPVRDHGFKREVAWDIPLTDGYEYELVPNTSSDPGTHHFMGLRNPALVERVAAWGPDVMHITGWAWHSHLLAMRRFSRLGVPILFRGDSHLLDESFRGVKWWAKKMVLRRVFSWPALMLYVGKANRAYYEAFGVRAERLYYCPHSIDVARFSDKSESYEIEARRWREDLGIGADQLVLLFAGKFEPKKRPVELMQTFKKLNDQNAVLIMVGNGELEGRVKDVAATAPGLFRVLPFQNQSRMPVVYRLGDLFVLPSAYGETWGLAVNEALSCGRPVLVSDRVGCAADVVDASCGRVYPADDMQSMMLHLKEMIADRAALDRMRSSAINRAWRFDVSETEMSLLNCMSKWLKT